MILSKRHLLLKKGNTNQLGIGEKVVQIVQQDQDPTIAS
jgi:hypothetical protein